MYQEIGSGYLTGVFVYIRKLRLDLPGMNSYQRLMVHKLAPYYKLNHYHDAMKKSVYVCKTFITEL